jgi:hypothetical protein
LRSVIICLGILALGALYFFVDPVKGNMPDCPFYSLTGIYCPGCGTQRGLHALLHGNVTGAIGYNSLMVLSLLYFVSEAAIWILRSRGKQIRTLSSRRYVPLIVLVITLAFWVLRNIPVAPFTMLAP